MEWQSLGGLSGLFLRGSHFVGRQGPALVSVETVGSSGAWSSWEFTRWSPAGLEGRQTGLGSRPVLAPY